MRSCRLTSASIHHSPVSQTKVIVAHNDEGDITVAFRGTMNVPNMLTDVSCTKAVWESMTSEQEAPYFKCCPSPFGKSRVHQGFIKAFWADGIGDAMIGEVMGAVDAAIKVGREPDIRVTGHSLGGGLAIIATWEIYHACRLRGIHLGANAIRCYTL